MFSKSTEYAIRAIIFLAVHAKDDKLIGTTDIANELDFPAAFLGKVMQNLVRKGLVISVKGPGGGFYIKDETCNYSILNIVEILEDLQFLSKCGLGLHTCGEKNPCPIHEDYLPVKENIRNALSKKSIKTIKEDIMDGNYSMQFDLY